MSNLLYMQTIVFDPDYFRSERKYGIKKTEKLIEYCSNVKSSFSDKFNELDIFYKDLCKDGAEEIISLLSWIEVNLSIEYKLQDINTTKVYSDKKYFYYIW